MKTKGKKHRGRGCLTALIILALIAAAAAFLIKDSRDDLEISRYEVKSQKLPESFDGFKIVQLSDLHGAEFGEDGMGLVEKVKELEPDMIALTGDFVTDEGDLAAVEKLNREQGITVFLITHHMNEAEHADRVIVMNDGLVVMDGTPREIFSRGEELRAIGLDVPQAVALAQQRREKGFDVPEGIYKIEEVRAAVEAIVGKGGRHA